MMKTIHVYTIERRDKMFAYFVTDDRHVRFLSPFLSTSEGDHESVRRLIAEKIGDDYTYGVNLYPLTVVEEGKRLAESLVEVQIGGRDISSGLEYDGRWAQQCPLCLNEFDVSGHIETDTGAFDPDTVVDGCGHFYELGDEAGAVVYRGKAGDLVGDEIPPAGGDVCKPIPHRRRPDLVPDIEKKKAIVESDLVDARLAVNSTTSLTIEHRILADLIKAYERQIEVYEMAIAHNKEPDHA